MVLFEGEALDFHVPGRRKNAMTKLPSFDQLPLQSPGPRYNAWGLWGPDDELGRINLITPAVVKKGLAEAREGIVVNLK